MTTVFTGHPSESERFSFIQTITGRDGFRHEVRSYVAHDSRWPRWRRALVRVLDRLMRRFATYDDPRGPA